MKDQRADDLVIELDDPRRPEIVRLLEVHLAFAHEHSAPEDVHALDVDALVHPAIRFYSAKRGGVVVGVGALKLLDENHREIKSMHTSASERGRGIGRLMVRHLIDVARTEGAERVSLETGTVEAFAPARALYTSLGFRECAPFGDYWSTPASVCMTLMLR